NAHHGRDLINELVAPWLAEMGAAKPLGVVEAGPPPERVQVDCRKYVGVYENGVLRFRVSQRSGELYVSMQVKFAFYEITSLEETRPVRLVPLGHEQFLVRAGSQSDSDSAEPDASAIVAFRNPGADGSMQHLGYRLCLFPRIS